jgi:hypothetical protein
MPNELSEKVYPDGTVVKLRDDAARGDIDAINNKLTSMNSFHLGPINGSSGTLVQQCVAFALNVKNTYRISNAFEGMFFYSSASKPSDVPANEQIWNYAYGKFLIRAIDGNNNVDATIILFAFGASKIAIKSVANSAQSSNWAILGA